MTEEHAVQDVWERKYHLALERMERDERDFRAIEEGLRRLSVRLAALARGQGTDIDRLLDRLGEALRGAPSADVLESLLDALAEAVTGLDQLPPAVNDDARPDETPAVPGIPTLDDPGAADDRGPTGDHGATVDALRADIARLQDLLAAVSMRLGDMTRFLASELEGDDVSGSRALDSTVREEMRALGERTLAATNLGELQAEVNERLSMIDRHFREYRDREDARTAAYRDRTQRMRDRVDELETQATSLQDSLRREHALALTDPLTGLPNRLAYERHMAAMEHAVRSGTQAACVAAFDIDHFKTINDSFGHAAGDAVLRIVGQTLARELPEGAFVARYGGEEFVVVFGNCTHATALTAATGLCAMVEALAFHASGRPVKVTMSGGITTFTVDDTAARAFDRADRALYMAKRAGRNQCVAI